jgi:RNA polymerase sigma-70 factor (ECF subfamily)
MSEPTSQPPSASLPRVAPPDFEALVEEVLPAALKTAIFLCRDLDDAEDLVQEAALQAFRQFEKFEGGTNFKAWFLKVQHNCFLGRLRHDSRRPQSVQIDAEQEVEDLFLFEQTRRQGGANSSAGKGGFGSDPAAQFLAGLESEQIAGALRDLPPEFRVVCTLYFVHEMGYEQIAQVIECPLNTVRSRLHRGRKYLQKALWEIAQERGLSSDGPSSTSGASGGLRSWILLAAIIFWRAGNN